MTIDETTGEVVELIRHLIRNACVNDGTSGTESTSAATLAGLLDLPGVELETYEPFPGRATLAARLPGSDPDAPSLAYVTHTDVVPAGSQGWDHDPFGADLDDGFVWGRGAIDMLNLTSSMAVVFRRLALGGYRPRGSLVFVAAADEEAGGLRGAGWLLDHHPELAMADYVVTETGSPTIGSPTIGGQGVALPVPLLPVAVFEKGMAWCTVTVRGTPGHGSRPYRADNAAIKAAGVVERIAAISPRPVIVPAWERFVREAALPAALADPAAVGEAVAAIADPAAARRAHACTHTTFSPNVVRGGDKTNIIPDLVEVEVDVRTMPGLDAEGVRDTILDALGDLAGEVSISFFHDQPPTVSAPDTPLWEALEAVASGLTGGVRLVPTVMTGCTDARFWRERGSVAYGFGLFSDAFGLDEHESMFHGRNERVDVESLRLSTLAFDELARRFSA
ncbi:MAG TPA: M20/M25/M40 family metallo-hydrolase [Acidimicrobiales bacterium]|nr:M20/M25/M40 family metallo-hydrolase [Acidimicrobiales bacterium]